MSNPTNIKVDSVIILPAGRSDIFYSLTFSHKYQHLTHLAREDHSGTTKVFFKTQCPNDQILFKVQPLPP